MVLPKTLVEHKMRIFKKLQLLFETLLPSIDAYRNNREKTSDLDDDIAAHLQYHTRCECIKIQWYTNFQENRNPTAFGTTYQNFRI